MANFQQGWQYPQPPMYPQGSTASGSMALSMRPAAMRRAVSLMYVGAVLSVAYGLVDGIIAHSATLTSSTTTSAFSAGLVAGAIIEGIAQVVLWLWMAWKTGTGRGWARVLSTVFFGFMCVQLIVSLAVMASGKGTGAPAVFIVILVEWGVGLAALIQLWRRESSEFFAFTKRAQLADAYGAAYYGYQPFGYNQAPQAGQPQYDESSPHNQEPLP
jgi:hypothetical protein